MVEYGQVIRELEISLPRLLARHFPALNGRIVSGRDQQPATG